EVRSPEGPGPEAPPTPPWHTDPWGGVLVVGGVAGLGAGIGLYVQSRADARAAQSADTLQSYDDRATRALRLDRAGIATMAIGSALIAGGVIRYVVVATRGRRSRVALVPAAGPRGLGALAAVRF
ncbi:MAG: hypothetical protein KDK70_26705, partial [Myxococcales bacterium]|nr:hypothetical protein [Myxococcales bacterium]